MKIKLLTILFCLYLVSCATVKDGYKTTRMVVPGGPEVFIAQNNDNFELSSPIIPGITFIGAVSGKTLYITSVRLFSNWQNGWTEGFYQASGKYLLENSVNSYNLVEVDPLEIWDIESGEIRYKGNYYRGDDGLQKVRNRVDRIREYVSVIKENRGPDYLGGVKKASTVSLYSIKGSLYPKLFPEVEGFKKLEKNLRLPKLYYSNDYPKEKVEGSNIYWRTDYTKSVFPEHLWELRDSGTIFRDFEETPQLIVGFYNLDGFIENKLPNSRLVRIED